MATTFVQVANQTETHTEESPQKQSESDNKGAGDSMEEEFNHKESNSKSKRQGTNCGHGGTGGKPSKIQWYYAVAHGQVPGVYTDWRTVEQQVNGYSRAVQKKFRD